ncbi:alpha/beta-hydrolase family protein [Gordonia sp. CPCC 206044]|uniref:alpha/beta-hydrolase family protein n=1 Tax=Gordonia sp. CPCC 206044 TaxID=3140793 RepID=UPI003AF40B21
MTAVTYLPRTQRYSRSRDTRGLPHIAVSIAATAGAMTGLWPSGLPRSAVVSGLLTAAIVAIATVIALVATRHRRVRPPVAAAGLFIFAGALTVLGILSVSWQKALRTDLGAPQVGVEWMMISLTPAAVAFGAIVFVPRVTALVVATAAALMAGYLPAATADDTGAGPRTPAGVVYAPQDGRSLAVRSQALAQRWADDGGLDRRAVVIAVPTGSGWVDPAAVNGYTDRFHGDVSVIALQYAHEPSWQAFIGDRSGAGRSATAVLDEVIAQVETRGAAPRPEIHLYGQSLGALGADAAREWADRTHPGAVADTVLAGVPGDSVAPGPGPGSPRTVLANASDPVARWSWSLLWRPASPPQDTTVVGREVRRPPWLPIVGFVQTSTDLLTSLDGPAGVGHRYGPEQAHSMGPRAAS